jgi:hypothetical protein
LSNQFRSVVCSFVLGYDVVPRVSYGSLARLKRQSLAVMRHLPGNVQRLRAGAGGTLGLGDAALAASVRAWLDDGGAPGEEGGAALGPTSLHDKMFPAGSLFHLLPPSPPSPPPAEAADSGAAPSVVDGPKAGGDSGLEAEPDSAGGSGEGKTKNEEEGEWRMERTNFSFFADIIISPSMLTDHLPNTYETGFQGILRRQALRRKKAGPFFFVEPPSS